MREDQLLALSTLAAAGLATVTITQLTDRGWRLAFGKRPPDNPAAPDVSWGEALLYATATGLLVGVGRMVAKRLATSGLESRLGHRPRGLRRSSGDPRRLA